MAKKSGGANKSEAIREYLNANPNAKPREIVGALKSQGLNVTPAFVSTIKSKSASGAAPTRGRGRPKGSTNKTVTTKGRRGRPPGKKAAVATSAARVTSSNPYEDLISAKNLVDKVGGIEKARAALEALAKITG